MNTDTEMLDWLSERCWFPNDHPNDVIVVLVPEKFAANGSFTLNPENDRKVLRNAIQKAMDLVPESIRLKRREQTPW